MFNFKKNKNAMAVELQSKRKQTAEYAQIMGNNGLALEGTKMKPNPHRKLHLLSGLTPGIAIKNLDYML